MIITGKCCVSVCVRARRCMSTCALAREEIAENSCEIFTSYKVYEIPTDTYDPRYDIAANWLLVPDDVAILFGAQ